MVKSALGEAARHQEAAVAIERLAFRAHQADARVRCGVDQLIQAGAKLARCAAIAS